MNSVVLSFLPAATCLFWICLNFATTRKTVSFKAFQLFLFALGLYIYANAGLTACSTVKEGDLPLFFLEQFAALLPIPFAIGYLSQFTEKTRTIGRTLVTAAVPAAIVFAEVILLLLIGAPGCVKFITGLMQGQTYSQFAQPDMRVMYLCSVYVFYAVLGLEAIIYIIWMIKALKNEEYTTKPNIYNFLFKGDTVSVFHLQCLNITLVLLFAYANLIHRYTIVDGCPALFIVTNALLTVFAFITGFAALFQLAVSVLLADMHICTSFENMIASREQVKVRRTSFKVKKPVQTAKPVNDSIDEDGETGHDDEEEENKEKSLAASISAITAIQLDPEDEDSLRARFEHLMVNEQLFLKQGIKIADIAELLQTNRTYISRHVNNTYNMSFSDYINILRIDYAEQYLINNRDAKQAEIAAACGFPNASSFNNIFKKVTGMTPKIWLATNAKD